VDLRCGGPWFDHTWQIFDLHDPDDGIMKVVVSCVVTEQQYDRPHGDAAK
jgi:hypothetical protein